MHYAIENYTVPKSGKMRTLKRRERHIYDCAMRFSAYAIDDDTLIDVVELMMIRLVPNDLLNVRMEGNTTLRPFVTPTSIPKKKA